VKTKRLRNAFIAAAVIVGLVVGAFFGLWWWLSPKGPWVEPMSKIGCQGMAIDRQPHPSSHEVWCLVFAADKMAPSCERVMETYTGAGGPLDGGVKVIVEQRGHVVCTLTRAEDGCPCAVARHRLLDLRRRLQGRETTQGDLDGVLGRGGAGRFRPPAQQRTDSARLQLRHFVRPIWRPSRILILVLLGKNRLSLGGKQTRRCFDSHHAAFPGEPEEFVHVVARLRSMAVPFGNDRKLPRTGS
jgi:hypothetical protein